MSIGDGDFKPKPFKGTETDTEKTEQWLEYFHTYAAFRQITGQAKLQLFRLLLVDQAAEWWRSLPVDVLRDFDNLVEAFRRRYSLTDVERWKKATTIWQRDQKQDESVAAYITAVQNLCRLVPSMTKYSFDSPSFEGFVQLIAYMFYRQILLTWKNSNQQRLLPKHLSQHQA